MAKRSIIDFASHELVKNRRQEKWPQDSLEWTESDYHTEKKKNHGKVYQGSFNTTKQKSIRTYFLPEIKTLVFVGEIRPSVPVMIGMAQDMKYPSTHIKKFRYIKSTKALEEMNENTDWWGTLTREEQEAYLKEHPKSKKRVRSSFDTIKRKDEPDEPAEDPSGSDTGDTGDIDPTLVKKRKLTLLRYLLGAR